MPGHKTCITKLHPKKGQREREREITKREKEVERETEGKEKERGGVEGVETLLPVCSA